MVMRNRQGVILGYTGASVTKIREGVLQLMSIIQRIEEDKTDGKKPPASYSN